MKLTIIVQIFQEIGLTKDDIFLCEVKKLFYIKYLNAIWDNPIKQIDVSLANI